MHDILEGKILDLLSSERLNPDELAARIDTSSEDVREAVLGLLDRGAVDITLDWRLTVRER